MSEPPQEPPDDFVDAVKAGEAAQRARQAAIAPPPRPPRRTNQSALSSWLDAMVSGLTDDVAAQGEGTREITLNNAALRIGGFIYLGVDRANAERELFGAAQRNGWVAEEGESQVRWKIKRGIEDGIRKPLERPDLDAENYIGTGSNNAVTGSNNAAPWEPGGGDKSKTGKKQAAQDAAGLVTVIKGTSASRVQSSKAMWVWEWNDVGRIQLGTLSIFAGKPAAGKSTAVRWFAARISKGELPGAWFGYPMKVAPIFIEEQRKAIVVPSLKAAGADMNNIILPDLFDSDGRPRTLEIQRDEYDLTQWLLENEIRALFIDPIMSTIGGSSDVNRNNEMREKLTPLTRIAEAINGIAIAITHLKKGDNNRDIMDAVHSSTAFVEVPRAVFGFAPTGDGEHILEQVKNNAGLVGLKLKYELPIDYGFADDGQAIELPRFEITGETEVSIVDINPNSDETTDIGQAKEWLKMYLLENQPMPSAQVKLDAKKFGDIQPWTLKRAMKEMRVVVTSRSEPGKTRTTVWALPDGPQAPG